MDATEQRLQELYGGIDKAQKMQVEKEARHLARMLTNFERRYNPRMTNLLYKELAKYGPTREELKNLEGILETIRRDRPDQDREGK